MYYVGTGNGEMVGEGSCNNLLLLDGRAFGICRTGIYTQYRQRADTIIVTTIGVLQKERKREVGIEGKVDLVHRFPFAPKGFIFSGMLWVNNVEARAAHCLMASTLIIVIFRAFHG